MNHVERLQQPLRINWILPGANMAGGTKSNRLIAEAMHRRGHEVRLIYPDVPPSRPSVWKPRAFSRHLWNGLATRGKQRHHLEQSTVKTLRVSHRPIQPEDVPDADVVMATWWETMEWIADWPESKGLNAYFVRGHELHGGDPDRVKATYRTPAQKFVIARWLQDLMREEYDDPNAVLVPNGVDWSQFNSSPRVKQKYPTVGVLFSKTRWKDVDTAFEAFRIIQREIPDLRVISFGSTPINRKHRTPRNFEFYLRPPQDTLADLYRQADCWVMSSKTEGFGMPGLEAAACRCPVVSTRCGGPEDYVEDGVNGYLVPVGDSSAMADAIMRVLRAEDLQWKEMSEASYRIAQQFDWDKSAAILENSLHFALQNRISQNSVLMGLCNPNGI